MTTAKEVFSLSKSLLDHDLDATPENAIQLGSVLRFHEKKYYIDNDPIISDTEYDLLFKKLLSIEAQNPALILEDSPTQRVGSDLTDKFQTVEHIIPMLSLDNSYNEEDLRKFDEQIHKLTALPSDLDITYTVEPKFDGGSVAVIYEEDVLKRAATRGNGYEGEDFTNNARQIATLPLRADFKSMGINKAELRGEAVIDKSVFARINLNREKEGKALFANPRNTAAGGLRTKDPRETKERGTEVFIFQIGYAIDKDGSDQLPSLQSHYDSIEHLGRLGFKVDHKARKKCLGIDQVIQHINEWASLRETYPYEIDGMVVKVDDFQLQQKCGSTSHHPRWAIAFKFKAKQATTTLERVEFQVGKIGSITPVAKVTPVALAGVTVSSISLHNEDFIRNKDLRLGDQIIIERAGDVIPYIARSLADMRSGEEHIIDFPTECPSCHTKLVRTEGESAWRCPNTQYCPEQILQRLFHHVSKDAMDIDGLGPAQIQKFYELGWIRDMSDLYQLDDGKIAALEGFGQKSAENLMSAIEVAKRNPIYRLLHSLSIHHLGRKVSKIIAEKIPHVLKLQDWTLEDYVNIPEIGPVVAQNMIDYFSNPENIAVLKKMETLGVNLSQTEEDQPKTLVQNAVFNGKTILFTGTLSTLSRKEAQSLAEDNGAKNISAVSSNLDYLVVGEKAGSKRTKAQKIPSITILTEAEFLSMLSGDSVA